MSRMLLPESYIPVEQYVTSLGLFIDSTLGRSREKLVADIASGDCLPTAVLHLYRDLRLRGYAVCDCSVAVAEDVLAKIARDYEREGEDSGSALASCAKLVPAFVSACLPEWDAELLRLLEVEAGER